MSRRSFRPVAALGVAAFAIIAAVWMNAPRATAQSKPGAAPAGEWRAYGADNANTRYSALDQINAENFGKLEVAWRFKTDALGPRPEFNLQTTPLMVGGRLFATAGTRRAAIALDAGTGELLWTHSLNEGKRGEEAPRQLSGRGLVVLDRWQGRADRLRHARLSDDRARRENRRPYPGLRPERHRRPQAGHRSEAGRSGRNRAARDAGHCQERRDRRRRAPAGRVAARPGERQGLRPRLRRAHRQAPVDFPHDPPPGRVRQRHVAERFLVVYRQHRRLGADQRRRGARDWRTCRSRFRRATTTAVIVRATTCSPRAWSRSI